MLKKITITTLLVLVSVLVVALALSACTVQLEVEPTDFSSASSYLDFIDTGARIGSEAGDIYGQVARDIFSASETPKYPTIDEALDALLAGEIDTVLVSGGFARQLLQGERSVDFEYLAVPSEIFINKAGPIFHSTELRDAYNEWFAQASAGSTWNAAVDRWLHGTLPDEADIPRFEFTGENGTLRVADTGNYPPLSFIDSKGEIVGYDMEMTSHFAQYMGMDIEVIQLPYEEILSYVASGEVDMSACTYSILADRHQDLIFGEPSVFTQAVLVIPRNK